jgi:hypothetical protein
MSRLNLKNGAMLSSETLVTTGLSGVKSQKTTIDTCLDSDKFELE